MSLATFTDANAHLDEDKVKFHTVHEAEPIATSVDRTLRGTLAGIYGDQASNWDANPTGGQVATPELIREIASMYMAADLYDKKYAIDADVTSTHATRLRRRADELIQQLREGTLTLVEAGITSGIDWSEDDFWPNSKTVVEDTTQPDRKFFMDMEF